MKTQVKIALALISTNILIISLFGGSIYYFVHNYSYTDFYKRLETRATIAARYNLDRDNINSESYKAIREEHLEKLKQEREYLLPFNDADDLERLADLWQLPLSLLQDIYRHKKATLQINDSFYTGILYVGPTQQKHLVIVSAQNYYASNHLLFIKNILIISIAFSILIISYLSFYFSKNIFLPIRRITEQVKAISTDNIHLRITERDNDDDIGVLTATFNDLLNRLETAFETQKNFISNASHEFGTPLTAIMGEAEVMLMKERQPEEYQQSLNSILEQAERLNQITQTLIYLAQTGYRNKGSNFEVLRADELIWETKHMMDKLNPKNGIQIDLSLLPENPQKLKVLGNKQLLYLAFTNILTNACKYSNNQPVHVSIASSDSQVFIVVKDQGIGIPEAEMPFIYDPFFRASNTHQFEGYGIGLPLTRNIIRIHNGLLLVSSVVNEGTTVQIRLPLAVVV